MEIIFKATFTKPSLIERNAIKTVERPNSIPSEYIRFEAVIKRTLKTAIAEMNNEPPKTLLC